MARPVTRGIKNFTRKDDAAYERQLYHAKMRRIRIQQAYAARGEIVKVCRLCDQPKPLTEENFRKIKSSRDGWSHTCEACHWKRSPRRRKQNAEKRFKRTHGYTRAERDAVLVKAAVCDICGHTGKLFVDHCHIELKMRGVLCNLCNSGIGKFYDNPELLEAAARYLRERGYS